MAVFHKDTDGDIIDVEAIPARESDRRSQEQPQQGTVTVAHVVYALHSLSILIGLFTAGAAIVSAFVFSAPSILAVIINYIFRSDARGTWVESHYSWQIKTFWYALLWLVLLFLLSAALIPFLGFGFFVLFGGMFILGIWVAIRIFIGWKRLVAHRAMPQ